jgi:hypothetical protein
MKKFLIASTILVTAALGACTPGVVTKEGSVTLSPSRTGGWVQNSYAYPANDTAWPCPLDKSGTGGAPEVAGTLLTGFDHAYDAGTRPFPCSRKLIHIYRAAMNFDLKEITNLKPRVFVTNATLHYNRSPDPASGRTCADALLLATDNWQAPGYKNLPPGDAYVSSLPTGGASCGLGGCAVDVTSAVRNWVSGAEAQRGFVIRGENESTDAKDNDSCLTRYRDVSLSVSYKYDMVPIFPPEK